MKLPVVTRRPSARHIGWQHVAAVVAVGIGIAVVRATTADGATGAYVNADPVVVGSAVTDGTPLVCGLWSPEQTAQVLRTHEFAEVGSPKPLVTAHPAGSTGPEVQTCAVRATDARDVAATITVRFDVTVAARDCTVLLRDADATAAVPGAGCVDVRTSQDPDDADLPARPADDARRLADQAAVQLDARPAPVLEHLPAGPRVLARA